MKIAKNNIQSTLWRYYLFVFLRDFVFFSAVLIPFFTDWGGISLIQVQILQSWFMLWIFILEIPTGAVADYIGRKHSLTLGALVTVFAALLYGSIPRFEMFLLAEFLFAAGVAFTSGADKALLYDALKEKGQEAKSKEIFGRAHTVHLIGILVSAPIGGFIGAKLGLNAPMLLSAISFLLAALVAWSIKEPKRYEGVPESIRYWEVVKNGVSFFYKHKQLRGMVVDGVLVAAAAYFVIWLYQPLLKSVQFPLIYFGFIHAFLVFSEVLVANNFSRLEKIFGSEGSFLRASTVLTALGFLVAGLFPSLLTITLFIIFAGGFGLTRIEYWSAIMNKLIPSDQRATVLSSVSMFRRFALVFLNPFVGFMADRSLTVALLLLPILPLVALFLSLQKKSFAAEPRGAAVLEFPVEDDHIQH